MNSPAMYVRRIIPIFLFSLAHFGFTMSAILTGLLSSEALQLQARYFGQARW